MDHTVNKELHAKIQAGLEEIRPFLQSDGGDCEFIEVTDELVVRIELKGMCADCSMSATTVKGGIEETIKRHAPEIKAVEALSH